MSAIEGDGQRVVLVDNWSVDRLIDRWPKLSSELRDALIAEAQAGLANSVDALEVVQRCGCGDDFCQSFYTADPPDGVFGPGHRNVLLDPPWTGMLILDVVDDAIVYVEVLDRPPLD
jgi:hypothetical protein